MGKTYIVPMSMKALSGTFISIEEVVEELRQIHHLLDLLFQQGGGSGEVVWASQATLAKRYDMSKANMCRLLAGGMETGKIRTRQPNGGVRKYHVDDVDAYTLSVSREAKSRFES